MKNLIPQPPQSKMLKFLERATPGWRTLLGWQLGSSVRRTLVALTIIPVLARIASGVKSPINVSFGGVAHELNIELPFTWGALYFAAICFFAGAFQILLSCPATLRKYRTPSDFYADGPGSIELMNSVVDSAFEDVHPRVSVRHSFPQLDESNPHHAFYARQAVALMHADNVRRKATGHVFRFGGEKLSVEECVDRAYPVDNEPGADILFAETFLRQSGATLEPHEARALCELHYQTLDKLNLIARAFTSTTYELGFLALLWILWLNSYAVVELYL